MVWTVLLHLSVLSHDYRGVLFLSHSITVTEWPCLILLFCEIVFFSRGILWPSCYCKVSSQLTAEELLLFFLKGNNGIKIKPLSLCITDFRWVNKLIMCWQYTFFISAQASHPNFWFMPIAVSFKSSIRCPTALPKSACPKMFSGSMPQTYFSSWIICLCYRYQFMLSKNLMPHSLQKNHSTYHIIHQFSQFQFLWTL